MLLEYIQEALERARYELIKNEEPYYGEVPELRGVWATGKSLEECRRNLKEVNIPVQPFSWGHSDCVSLSACEPDGERA